MGTAICRPHDATAGNDDRVWRTGSQGFFSNQPAILSRQLIANGFGLYLFSEFDRSVKRWLRRVLRQRLFSAPQILRSSFWFMNSGAAKHYNSGFNSLLFLR